MAALLENLTLVFEQQTTRFLISVFFYQSLLALNDFNFEVLKHFKHEFSCFLAVLRFPMHHIMKQNMCMIAFNVVLCVVRHLAVVRLQL